MNFPVSSAILIRPALFADAAFVAEMILFSMGHLADHLFCVTGKPALPAVRKLVESNAGRFGLTLASIAEIRGQPVGALVSCKGRSVDLLNLATLPYLFSVMGVGAALRFIKRSISLPGGREAAQDEYYVSNLGVHSSAQGQGIGSHLLAYAEQTAQSAGLTKCALVVGLYNQNALRLYQRFGYQIVETVQHPSDFLGYHRMVKVI